MNSSSSNAMRRRGPVSNTERQRQFRARNPGYYGRRNRIRKHQIKLYTAAFKAALAARLDRKTAIAVATCMANHNVDLLQAIAQAKQPLMLPAPVMTLESLGFNAARAQSVVEIANS